MIYGYVRKSNEEAMRERARKRNEKFQKNRNK